MFKLFNRLLRNRDKGFTLIELMVVVVILGILAAIAVPQLSGKSDQAKENRARADLKVLESALELYYFEEDAFPASGNEALTAALQPDYVKKVKSDPWGQDYVYDQTAFAARTEFGLYSLGSTNGAGTISNLD